MKRIITGVVCAIALVGVISYNLLNKQNKDKIVIGVTGPQVGIYADIGQSLINGVFLSCEDVNKNTGGSVQFVIDAQNDGGEPKNAMSCLNKFQARGVDGLIVMGDNQVPTLAAKISAMRVPSVATIVATSEFLHTANSSAVFLFRNYSNVEYAAEQMAGYAFKVLKAKNCAILHTQNPYGINGASAYKKCMESLGCQIFTMEGFDEHESTQRGLVSKSLKEKPDVIYVIGFGVGYNVVINQIREFGYKGNILTDEPISGPSCTGVIKDFSNIYFTNNPIPESEEYNRFCRVYEQKFNVKPNIFAVYGFDSMKILGEAFLAANGNSAEVPQLILQKKKFKTLLGGIEFKENGDCIIPVAINKMNADGSYVRMQ